MGDNFFHFLNVTIVIFMAGNLLGMGLEVALNEARGALGNIRFLFLAVVWSFVLCPALAYLLAKIIPVPPQFGVGLILLGMAPCAPFLPKAAKKAEGDLAYVAAFMLITSIGTVVFMPLAIPVMLRGFSTSAWLIAKPLILFIAIPLAIGIAIRARAASFALKVRPIVGKFTDLDTAVMLLILIRMYGKDYLNAVGSYAIGGQVLFYSVVAVGAYSLHWGLEESQRSVLAIGLLTRNIGAAVAPLMSAKEAYRHEITMVTLAVPLTVIGGFGAAAILRRRALSLQARRTVDGTKAKATLADSAKVNACR